MLDFDLIQCIRSNVLCRLLQITDTARISVQIDNCIEPVRRKDTFILSHADPLQNFRECIF